MKISQFYVKARDSYIEFYAQAGFKFRFVALIGAIGFPLYYFIWTYLFPQPYENLTLRIIGSVSCLLLALSPHWPKKLKKYDILYGYISMFYALPFFFTYMFLMNDGNIVWQLSSMAAFLFILLLYNTINMVIVIVAGSLLGFLCYHLQTGSLALPEEALLAMPVFGFTFIGFILLNYNDDIIFREKLKTASLLAGQIAHEMRTPLLGIQFEAEKTEKFMPVFLEAYEWARNNGWNEHVIKSSQLSGLRGSMQRIKDHSSSANLMIDTLLINVRHKEMSGETYEKCSAQDTILLALERYHFKGNEKSLITFHQDIDFDYWGSKILLTHVLFNLIRNALRAIHSKGHGHISIKTHKNTDYNQIIFKDTGEGIEEDMIKYIFIPFFSGTRNNNSAGVGLSFARTVIESFGGTITCQSNVGKGTIFTIALPELKKNPELK